MSNHIADAEKILAEYGRRMFESHARYFDSDEIDNSEFVVSYTHVSPRSSKRILKRALILCATMILIMSLTVVVCSALGLQIFNYKFDFRDGYIVITNLDEENGSYYYKPEYIADNYTYQDTLLLGETLIYTYTDDSGKEYTIRENKTKDELVYLDNEGYDTFKETYAEYELVVYRDQSSPRTMVYMEKNGTYIAITGELSMDQIHSIIDSLVIDETVKKD